jgi:hypothetical protein
LKCCSRIKAQLFAKRFGTTVDGMLAERARTGTLLKRFPRERIVRDLNQLKSAL